MTISMRMNYDAHTDTHTNTNSNTDSHTPSGNGNAIWNIYIHIDNHNDL